MFESEAILVGPSKACLVFKLSCAFSHGGYLFCGGTIGGVIVCE